MSANLIDPAAILACRILVIDDEPANLLLLANVLAREGYMDVHCISDPTTALDAVVRLAPDLVLLDLMMPDLDGFAVLEALGRHARPDSYCPVLVLTADTTMAARRRALALGAKDFVAKPFDVIEVGLRIANLLETRLLYQRLRARVATDPADAPDLGVSGEPDRPPIS